MPNTNYRVLCVCLGNICRSPTAEVILQEAAMRAGLNIRIDSAGTSNYHPNKAPDARSQNYALQHGYDLSELRARQIQIEDFEKFDLILAMDQENYRDILDLQKLAARRLKNTTSLAQISLMSQHDPMHPKQPIPDPYYGNSNDFERVIAQCKSSSDAWVEFWKQHKIG